MLTAVEDVRQRWVLGIQCMGTFKQLFVLGLCCVLATTSDAHMALAVSVFCMLQALNRYSELLLLLTGRRPSELLPPTPPSYIVNRVWQLAHSTCVKDYNWVSGGFG